MRILKTAFILFATIFFIFPAKSSANPNPDYNQAREYAFSGKVDSALIICDLILEDNPRNYDALLLKARVMGWQSRYYEARYILLSLLQNDSSNHEFLDAISDIDYWDNQLNSALYHVNKALVYFPNDSLFCAKKNLLEGLLTQSNQSLLSGNDCILYQYYMDVFYEFYHRRWQVFTIGFPVKFNTNWQMIPKINLGKLSSINNVSYYMGLQTESDFYYTPKTNCYLYGNMGFSNSLFFPKVKLATEYFSSQFTGFEWSLGFRYMHWDINHYYGTASVSKYFQKNHLSFRTFISLGETFKKSAYIFGYRRYFVNSDYVGLTYTFGSAPDQSFDQFLQNGVYKSQKVTLSAKKTLYQRYGINMAISFANEEYRLNNYQNRFDFLFGVTHCF